MKLALITDLHANREATEAVLAHAQLRGAERYAFLGDLVGYGADPAWLVDLVRAEVARGAIVVKGNHDAAVVDGPSPYMVEEAQKVVTWTRGRLDDSQLRFLDTLPMSVTDDDRLFVHANAYAPTEWGYVVERLEAARSMLCTAARFTFCGHVHEPKLFHLSSTGKAGDFSPQPDVQIPLSTQRQWLVIPGACGQPRDGNPAACYAIFDTAGSVLTYFRVPYDHDTAARKIRSAGLPRRFADRLRDGA